MKMRRLFFYPQPWQISALLDGSCTLLVWPVKPQPNRFVLEVADYCTGNPEHGLAYYWKVGGTWNSSRPFFASHAPGDRVWVAEEWHRQVYAAEGPLAKTVWIPAQKMPFRHSRLHLKIVAMECKRAGEITEEEAKKAVCRMAVTHLHDPFRETFMNYWLKRYGPASRDNWSWFATVRRGE